jgi:ADP-heptose:LPS heptosyltransferase
MPEKILAVKLRAIGDTVIWTAALNRLRRARPEAEIHVLTYAGNEAVLRHHPAVDRAHFLPSKSGVDLARGLWRLRSERFDWLLGFHATTSLCRWAWLAGAGRMILHHHSRTRAPRGSLPVEGAGRLEDAISRDARVLAAMGFGPLAPQSGDATVTSLQLSGEEGAAAERRMAETIRAVGGDPALPRFLFLPGAGHSLRRYPKDLLLPEIARVRESGVWQPVVIVDRAVSLEWDLAGACTPLGVPLLDQAGLREFIALVSRGHRALANDSGPGHIAVALGLTTDFVFGPGCVGDWHCYDRARHPLHRVPDLDCRLEGPQDRDEFRFCTVDECAHHSCLRRLRLDLDIQR